MRYSCVLGILEADLFNWSDGKVNACVYYFVHCKQRLTEGMLERGVWRAAAGEPANSDLSTELKHGLSFIRKQRRATSKRKAALAQLRFRVFYPRTLPSADSCESDQCSCLKAITNLANPIRAIGA